MNTDIKKLISEMTLEEKAGLCSGGFWHTKALKRLGIPSVMMSDGPHGLRKQEVGGDHLGMGESIRPTCFPAASGFDEDLQTLLGDALGRQCQAKDLAVLLGPGANIKRSPLCGRSFEYISEDPYLAGKLAAAWILGLQSRHVGASLKHFACNNQEFARMGVSSEVDERTLREIYLTPFEIAVREGRLDESLVDRAVENILKFVFEYTENRTPGGPYDLEAYHALAVDMETQCAVLLENNGVLPLRPGTRAAHIGAYAKDPRYQGSGSSRVNASRVASALEAAVEKGREVTFVTGFPGEGDELDRTELARALEAAKSADVAVIFAGLPDSFESEGVDRDHMRLPGFQDRLIGAVCAVQPNTVVVLHNGVAAVLEMYPGGQGVGEANPSGRLAETFPVKLEDNPSYLNFVGDVRKVRCAEGVYVGYRYYEKKKMPVRWAFGHGLSYTEFKYSNLRTDRRSFTDGEKLTVSVDVTNTGFMEGRKAVQLHVSDLKARPRGR